jgi:hypothetical protein
MLIDSLPTKATSSFEVSHARPPEALALVAAGRPARRANTSQAVSARETHGNPQLVRKPSDWTAGSRASLVQHGPTRTVFEISARPGLGPDDVLTLQDFRARPVPGGAAAPANADLEVLSGEAVLMALFLVGLAWPVVVN